MLQGVAMIVTGFIVMGAILNSPVELWAVFGIWAQVVRKAALWSLTLGFLLFGAVRMYAGR